MMAELFPDDHEIFAHAPSVISKDELIKSFSNVESSMFIRMTEDEQEDFTKQKAEDHERLVNYTTCFGLIYYGIA